MSDKEETVKFEVKTYNINDTEQLERRLKYEKEFEELKKKLSKEKKTDE